MIYIYIFFICVFFVLIQQIYQKFKILHLFSDSVPCVKKKPEHLIIV